MDLLCLASHKRPPSQSNILQPMPSCRATTLSSVANICRHTQASICTGLSANVVHKSWQRRAGRAHVCNRTTSKRYTRAPMICISPAYRAQMRAAALQLEGSLRGCPTLPPLAGAAFAGIVDVLLETRGTRFLFSKLPTLLI